LQPVAEKTFEACHKSPQITECPKKMWTKAFKCKKTENDEDEVYSENWSWGVYNDQFVMRYHTDGNNWKATEMGKVVGSPGATTCFTSLNDIRHVFLMHDLNAPSCKAETSFGADADQAVSLGDDDATLQTKSTFSFTITPAEAPPGAAAEGMPMPALASAELVASADPPLTPTELSY